MQSNPSSPKSLKYLLEGLHGCRVTGDDRVLISSLAYHSQDVTPGGLFVAIPGHKTDGRRFIASALAQGARVIVSEHDYLPPPGVTAVQVPEARLALAHLSGAFYDHPSRELSLIGITGTNGKTTTSYLLEAIFSAAGHRVGVLGTVNYRLGGRCWPAPVTTPESLDLNRFLREMVANGATHALLEVSSHALDLKRVDRVAFAAGIFTNLSQDHLDYHKNLDLYFAAKSRLFLEILSNGGSPAGLAVINLDDPRGRQLSQRLQVPTLTFGNHPESLVRPLSARFHREGLEARLATPQGELAIACRLVGPYNLSNILAAVAAALGLGITPDAVTRGVASLAGVPGRLERFGPAGGPHVFVDYAHTPDALVSVLTALKSLQFARLITVFGCGGDRDRTKRPLMGQAAAEGSDLVIVTSDNPRSEDPVAIIGEIEAGLQDMGFPPLSLAAAKRGDKGYLVVPERREAIRLAVRFAQTDDGVLVAGKGHEDYQIVGQERRHFDDREEVQEALRGKIGYSEDIEAGAHPGLIER
ncbi:MAG: UDP-N-acetylmuramoyl-L-alanyl-D-glutamate--2,6-diaminopimelate ligase [Deltaproteobacteria bacterium]|nr:UDP-N-acetylmuramoyl-L-alanyl-D-glutamate--2,6-diaminopimelate ligase [Deltaproteobacteria bacterium]